MSPERIVLDTEAYIAHYFDEPGSDVVDGWLNQVYDGELAGFVSTATLAEVRYIICGAEGETMDNADAYVEQLIWPNFKEDETNPRDVAELRCEYQIALGDAFALATAASKGARLIAGADDDWDEPIEDGYDIERFRTDPA